MMAYCVALDHSRRCTCYFTNLFAVICLMFAAGENVEQANVAAAVSLEFRRCCGRFRVRFVHCLRASFPPFDHSCLIIPFD